MRFYELIGLIDDIFTKYRKIECSTDSKWEPYSFYKNINDVQEGYSVYVGSKGLRDELEALLHRSENENDFKFTDDEWAALFNTLETANNQHNDNGTWTDIMFRSKYIFIRLVIRFVEENEYITY